MCDIFLVSKNVDKGLHMLQLIVRPIEDKMSSAGSTSWRATQGSAVGGTLHQGAAINKWDEIMETNLWSFFFAAKEGYPTIKFLHPPGQGTFPKDDRFK